MSVCMRERCAREERKEVDDANIELYESVGIKSYVKNPFLFLPNTLGVCSCVIRHAYARVHLSINQWGCVSMTS